MEIIVADLSGVLTEVGVVFFGLVKEKEQALVVKATTPNIINKMKNLFDIINKSIFN